MGGTVCLKSWYKSCEAIALAAIFALNSTPIWAANQIISSEETFYEADDTIDEVVDLESEGELDETKENNN